MRSTYSLQFECSIVRVLVAFREKILRNGTHTARRRHRGGFKKFKRSNLEAFTVNNGWARFIVFLLGDPHLLEGGQGSKDGASDPYRVFPLWWSNNLDLHGWWGKVGNFLLHTVSNTRVHGGTTRQDSVGVQVLTDIDVALHDGVVSGLVDTGGFHTQERWLEEGLWASESLVTNGDDLSVRELVGLLEG